MPYKDPEKQKEYMNRYREENEEKLKEYQKKWREENKEYLKEYDKKYNQENKEQRKEYWQKYSQENKEHLKEYGREYQKKRQKEKYHTDPVWKLRRLTSSMVRTALKEGKGGQSILPYVDWNSYEELKEHLESQFEDWMTWENHGMLHPTEKRWHIDHIKPQSVLLEGVTSMDDPKFRECWALENLRPLEARENIIKGNKINLWNRLWSK